MCAQTKAAVKSASSFATQMHIFRYKKELKELENDLAVEKNLPVRFALSLSVILFVVSCRHVELGGCYVAKKEDIAEAVAELVCAVWSLC